MGTGGGVPGRDQVHHETAAVALGTAGGARSERRHWRSHTLRVLLWPVEPSASRGLYVTGVPYSVPPRPPALKSQIFPRMLSLPWR